MTDTVTLLSKICSKCKTDKPREAFGGNKSTKDGCAFWCKSCSNAVYAANHPKVPRPDVLVGHKICSKCKEIKPNDDFGIDKARKDGLNVYCHTCVKCAQQGSRQKIKASNPIRLIPEFKTCTSCKVSKASSDFSPNILRSDGLTSRCKTCKTQAEICYRVKIAENFSSLVLPETKKCTLCKQTKSSADFNILKTTKGGLTSRCKTCTSDTYEAQKETDIVGMRVSQMIKAARGRAKKINVPFDLDDDYLRPFAVTHCPVLGTLMDYYSTTTSVHSPSLDKFLPEYGYVRGNVRVISYRANTMKNTANVDEVLRLANWMIQTDAEVRKNLNI